MSGPKVPKSLTQSGPIPAFPLPLGKGEQTADSTSLMLAKEGPRSANFSKALDRLVTSLDKTVGQQHKPSPEQIGLALEKWRLKMFPPPQVSLPPPSAAFLSNSLKSDPTQTSFGRSVAYLIAMSTVQSDTSLREFSDVLISLCKEDPALNGGVSELRAWLSIHSDYPGPSSQPATRLLRALEASIAGADAMGPGTSAKPDSSPSGPPALAAVSAAEPSLLGLMQKSAEQRRLEPKLADRLSIMTPAELALLAKALVQQGIDTAVLYPVSPLPLRIAVSAELAQRGVFVFAALPHAGGRLGFADDALRAADAVLRAPFSVPSKTSMGLGSDQLADRKRAGAELSGLVLAHQQQLANARLALTDAKSLLVLAIAALDGEAKSEAQAALGQMEKQQGELAALAANFDTTAQREANQVAALLENISASESALAKWPQNDDAQMAPQAAATIVELEALLHAGERSLQQLPAAHPLHDAFASHLVGLQSATRRAKAALSLLELRSAMPVLQSYGSVDGGKSHLEAVTGVEHGHERFYGAAGKPGTLHSLDDSKVAGVVAEWKATRRDLRSRLVSLNEDIATLQGELEALGKTKQTQPLTAAQEQRAHHLRAMLGDPKTGLGLRAQKLALETAEHEVAERTAVLENRWIVLEDTLQASFKLLGIPHEMSVGNKGGLIEAAQRLAVMAGVTVPTVTAVDSFGAIEAQLMRVQNEARAKQRITHHMVLVPRLRAMGIDWPEAPARLLPLLGQGELPKDRAEQAKLLAEYDAWLQKDYAKALTVLQRELGLQSIDDQSMHALFNLRGMDGQPTPALATTDSRYVQAERHFAFQAQLLSQDDLGLLRAHFAADTKRTSIPFEELRRLAASTDIDPKLRQAAHKLVQNPNAFLSLCKPTATARKADAPVNEVLSLDRLTLWHTRLGAQPAQTDGEGKRVDGTEKRIMLSLLRPGIEAKAGALAHEANRPGFTADAAFLVWRQALQGLSAEDKQALVVEYDRQIGKPGSFFSHIGDFPGATRGTLLHAFHTNETVESYADALLGLRSVQVVVPSADPAAPLAVGDTVDRTLESLGDSSTSEAYVRRFEEVLKLSEDEMKLVDSGIYSFVNGDRLDIFKAEMEAARKAVAAFSADPTRPGTAQEAARALAVVRLTFNRHRWSKVEADKSTTRVMRNVGIPVAVTGVAIVATIAAIPSGGTSVGAGSLAIAALVGTGAGTMVAFAGSYGVQRMRGADANYDDAWADSKSGAVMAATASIGVVLPLGAAGYVQRISALSAAGLGTVGRTISLAKVISAYPKASAFLTLPVTNVVSAGIAEGAQLAARKTGVLPDMPHQGPGMGFNLGRAGASGLMFSVLGGPFSRLSPAMSTLMNVGSGVVEESIVQFAVMPFLYPEFASQPESKEQAIVAIFQTGLFGLVSDRMFATKHARMAAAELRGKVKLGVHGDEVMVPPAAGKTGFVAGQRVLDISDDGVARIFDPKSPSVVRQVPARLLLELNPHIAMRAGAGKEIPPLGVVAAHSALSERIGEGRRVMLDGKAYEVGPVSEDGSTVILRTDRAKPRAVQLRDLLTQNPTLLRDVVIPLEVGGDSLKLWQIKAIENGQVTLHSGAESAQLPLGQVLDTMPAQLALQPVAILPPLVSGGKPAIALAPEVQAVVSKYQNQQKLGPEDSMLDGFQDPGAHQGGAAREVLVVDRTRDVLLRQMMSEVEVLRRLPEDERTAALQDYVAHRMNGAENGVDLAQAYTGRELLLGEAARLGSGSSRHRSLLFKVLGDHLGLRVSIARGVAPGAKTKSAWNDVLQGDGTSKRVEWNRSAAAQRTGAVVTVGADLAPKAPLARSAEWRFKDSTVHVVGIDPDGRVRVLEALPHGVRFHLLELEVLFAANPKMFDGMQLALPPKGATIAEQGFEIVSVRDGQVQAVRKLKSNQYQITSMEQRAFLLRCQAELMGAPQVLPSLTLPQAPPSAVNATPLSDAVRQSGRIKPELMTQVVALEPTVSRAVLRELAKGTPERAQFLAAVVQDKIAALKAGGSAADEALSSLSSLTRGYDVLGDTLGAMQYEHAVSEARTAKTQEAQAHRDILARLGDQDPLTAKAAFAMYRDLDLREALLLADALQRPRAYEAINTLDVLDRVRARAQLDKVDTARLDVLTARLVTATTLALHEGIPSGGLMTPLQAARAAEALLVMDAAQFAKLEPLLAHASSDYEAGLLLKAVAARQRDLVASDAFSREQAVSDLVSFARSIAGYDRSTLERMTTLVGVEYDATKQGWVFKGGAAQAFTTSCGPTSALIAAAMVDPTLAWKYRANPAMFESAQRELMLQQGARFSRAHPSREEISRAVVQNQIFKRAMEVVETNKHMTTKEERRAFDFWQGRTPGGPNGAPQFDPELVSLYQKLAPVFDKRGIKSFDTFTEALTTNILNKDRVGREVWDGTRPIDFLDSLIGDRAGVGYELIAIDNASKLKAKLPELERTLRTIGPTPFNVTWQTPQALGHALVLAEVVMVDGVRMWKIVDPAGVDGGKSRSVLVTDDQLLSANVIGEIHSGAKATISELMLPRSQWKQARSLPGVKKPVKVVTPATTQKIKVIKLGATPTSEAPPLAEMRRARTVSADLMSPLLGSDLGLGGAIAYKARLAELAKATAVNGGEVIAGSLSIQGFKSLNKPHDMGDAFIAAFGVQMRRLEHELYPDLEFFHCGGKEFTFVYTGKNPDHLAAVMAARFSGEEKVATQAAMVKAVAAKNAKFIVHPNDVQFYGGMARVRIDKGLPTLDGAERLSLHAAQASKQAQLTMDVAGKPATSLVAAREAKASKFAVLDSQVIARLIARDGPTRNELFPFGLDISSAVVALAEAGSTQKLSPLERYQLLVCQGQALPKGKAAADDLKRLALRDLAAGEVTKPRVKVVEEGADEIVVAGVYPGTPPHATLVYIDLNAFGAVNLIHDYPVTGALMKDVLALREKRRNPATDSPTGAELGDVLKLKITERIMAAVEQGQPPKEAIENVSEQLRGEFQADPHLSLTDKVETKVKNASSVEAALLAGAGEFTADFAGKLVTVKVQGRARDDGRVPVIVQDGANKSVTTFALYDQEERSLRLEIPNARPGLSSGVVTIRQDELALHPVTKALSFRAAPSEGERNLAGVWTLLADEASIRAKQRLKISLLLGEAGVPTMVSDALPNATGNLGEPMQSIYSRQRWPTLEPSLREQLTQVWEGGGS